MFVAARRIAGSRRHVGLPRGRPTALFTTHLYGTRAHSTTPVHTHDSVPERSSTWSASLAETVVTPPVASPSSSMALPRSSEQAHTHEKKKADEEMDVVTPWEVRGCGPRGIDYDRVLTRFRADRVDDEVRHRLSCAIQHRRGGVTGVTHGHTGGAPLHHFFTRQVVLSHRDFAKALEDMQPNATACDGYTRSVSMSSCGVRDGVSSVLPLPQLSETPPPPPAAYLYTGRGPSATSMHLGHAIPFLLTRYLQHALRLPLVIQITDDEKFLFRGMPFTGSTAEDMIQSNIKDIIAFGFDPRRTFIFRNTHYMGHMYPTVLLLQRALTMSAVSHTLGLRGGDCVGKLAFPATQAAPCFATALPHILPTSASASSSSSLSARVTRPRCIVPCAIDQDPFFVLTRAVAQRGLLAQSGAVPPAVLHTRFLPALKGVMHKMSSSAAQQGVIALSDSDAQVRAKLRKAFSGGCGTLQDMRQRGADLDVDVAYQFLRVFCTDEAEWQDITARYGSGAMHSGEVKERAGEVVLRDFLHTWRARRAAVSDADVTHFCSIRRLEC